MIDKSGERGRNRTYNLVIKSHLLCQLSYAPASRGGLAARNPAACNEYNIRPSFQDFLRRRRSVEDSVAGTNCCAAARR